MRRLITMAALLTLLPLLAGCSETPEERDNRVAVVRQEQRMAEEWSGRAGGKLLQCDSSSPVYCDVLLGSERPVLVSISCEAERGYCRPRFVR